MIDILPVMLGAMLAAFVVFAIVADFRRRARRRAADIRDRATVK